MTDDLDQLGPGAALDAICGREVMGLDVLGLWPTTANQDGGEPDLAKQGTEGAVLRPVYVQQCSCGDREDGWSTRHFCGVNCIYGHRYDCLAAVPPYSTEPAACAAVVRACRDAGWGDTAWTWDEIRQFGRSFVELDGECRTTGQRGPHEYAVACVAAVRVARLVGGPLVKH